jgi:hypothetical protein
MSVFRSAITGSDGTVDPGYLGLYIVMLVCLGTIPATLTLVAVRLLMLPDHPLDLTGIAAIIAAAGGCFGAAATGVGIFRWGDRPHPNTVTTTAAQTTVTSP